MFLLDILVKLFEFCIIGSVATLIILVVAAWMRGEFKK